MRSDSPHTQCQFCQLILPSNKYAQHKNLHLQPHESVPKTRPNNLKKIGISKVLHANDSTDESDLAVRSILPSEVPQPESQRRDVHAPDYGQINGKGGKGGNGKEGRVGSGSGSGLESGEISNSNYGSRNRLPANDHLDLNSNAVGVQFQKLSEQTLDIEKVIDLKPKKTVIPKKQIHKYQNSHNMARQTIDMGGCDKKLMANPLAQSRNVMLAPAQPVYEIKEVEKPFLVSLGSPDPKNKATVGFSRKTGESRPYNAIETKSVTSPNRKRPEPWQSNQPYSQSQSEDGGNNNGKKKEDDRDRQYPLHPYECPDCHGFYCSTCKSTIPPNLRPFWDENQSPEKIKYYKSLQQEALRSKGHKKECTFHNREEE